MLALLAGAVGGVGGSLVTHHYDSEPATNVGDSTQISAIARRALPSVVTIQIADSTGKPAGTGSGFVIRSTGYIVTNNHVAEGAGPSGKLTVQFSDNSSVRARIVGADASYDLAVVKVDHGTCRPSRTAIPTP